MKNLSRTTYYRHALIYFKRLSGIDKCLAVWIGFAFALGIIQDCALGLYYLSQVLGRQTAEGSFPFMFGWTVYMIWGIRRPLERRSVLLITAILVFFMALEKIAPLFVGGQGEFPLMNLGGIGLWTSAWSAARRLDRKKPD